MVTDENLWALAIDPRFATFVALREPTEDLGEVLADYSMQGIPGILYFNRCLYVEINPHDRGMYCLPLVQEWHESRDLRQLELRLFRFALDDPYYLEWLDKTHANIERSEQASDECVSGRLPGVRQHHAI